METADRLREREKEDGGRGGGEKGKFYMNAYIIRMKK